MRRSQRTWRLTAPVAAIAIFAAACGGSTEEEASSETTEEATGAAAAEGEDAPSEEPDAEPAEGDAVSGSVRIDGSSTVAPFGEVAAELFMQENPDVQVTVGVSGTGGGFEKFCNGETDISEASRQIADDEAALCAENGIAFEELSVALDGLVNVVPIGADFVECLTVEELNTIWAPDSTVSSWAEVRDGFPDVPLDLYGAGTDSGTFDYFTDAINGEEGAIRTDYNASEDDNVTVQGVSGSEGGLGFFGLSYANENADTLKALAVDNGDGCVDANIETVQDGSYAPLGRPLFMYPSDVALQRPEVVAFMEYTISNQAEISDTALFVPLTDEQATEAQAKVDALAGS